jgi:tetratricopeptide (TPR) repeat protein
MIGKSGVKVLDFGLAKSAQDETVTASHKVMGTPAYMAPEQREGKPADAPSDIYSFGCVLYEMSTGARVGPQRKRLSSRKLERIGSRCLEEDPGCRWQSVADLEKELAAGASNWKLVPAAVVMIVALLGATYFYLHRTPRLTDKDTIVLADFVNETDDRVFDGTLREALAIQLEESPFLKVLDESQVRQDLQLMRKSRGEPLTKELGREICQRENEKAMISGTIASLGKAYAITVVATNCESGATLARQQAEVPDKEHALDAIASIAKKVREKLGESLASIQSMAPPNDRVTTTSLEAFRAFAMAAGQFRQGHYLAAIPILRRAVELDPGFSTAWVYLGTAYQLAGDRSQQHEGYSFQRAFDLRNQASERERLLISTFYYYYVAHEWEKARELAEVWARTFPREYLPLHMLGVVYQQEGDLEGGLREFAQAFEMGGPAAVASNLARAYMRLGQFEEANAVIRKELSRNPDHLGVHQVAIVLALTQGDQGAFRKEVAWFSAKPVEYLALEAQAAAAFEMGQRRRERELLGKAKELRSARNLAVLPDRRMEEDALTGICESTRTAPEPSAVALALCSGGAQITRSVKKAEAADQRSPNATQASLVDLPLIRAAASLAQNHPQRAVEQLQSMDRLERLHPETIYLRGTAYLRMRQGAAAVGEFQKIIDHKSLYWGPFYPVSYLGLARGAVLAGDRAKAKKAFQDFLAFWNNADTDLPILQQAKAEYARL